jgi:hypothetical protein
MLLFAYRDITAWISRPTPIKWPEIPSRVTGGILRPLPKARGETGERCSSLGRSASVGTSGDPIGSRTVPAGISASGGHQAFPGGPCTPSIPPFSAVRRTVTIRPTGAYPVQSAMTALRRFQPSASRKSPQDRNWLNGSRRLGQRLNRHNASRKPCSVWTSIGADVAALCLVSSRARIVVLVSGVRRP